MDYKLGSFKVFVRWFMVDGQYCGDKRLCAPVVPRITMFCWARACHFFLFDKGQLYIHVNGNQRARTCTRDERQSRPSERIMQGCLSLTIITLTPLLFRRKRTSFSPATTLALEQFANAVNWKRGESDRINEFAQKHGLTFYQVKVNSGALLLR